MLKTVCVQTLMNGRALIIFSKQIIALGVLAMPTVLSATGGVPGSLIILVVGLLTTYSGHVVVSQTLRRRSYYIV